MAYFIYNIFPNRTLELLDEYATYREARDNVRERRLQLDDDVDYTVRLVHANNVAEAERLLTTRRAARPAGEE